MERGPLEYQDTRLRFLRQMRGFPGSFLRIGEDNIQLSPKPDLHLAIKIVHHYISLKMAFTAH